jgi:hypothetical protein
LRPAPAPKRKPPATTAEVRGQPVTADAAPGTSQKTGKVTRRTQSADFAMLAAM